MERQIATTREQSDRLLKCGVPAESADMSIDTDTQKLYLCAYSKRVDKSHEVPAFSLGCLLGLLPSAITDREVYFQLQLTAVPHEEDCYKWDLSYYSIEAEVTLYYNESPDPIEACVRMVERLTANGYKLNGIEEGGSEHGED